MSTIKPTTPSAPSAAQRLEELRKRLQGLLIRGSKAQAEVDTAARQRDEAKEEAKRDFGTDDLETLRELYVNGEQENARLLAEFENELNAYEAAVKETEAQLGA